jgi:pimeloyl-ACP methyl ester carboxylesterase
MTPALPHDAAGQGQGRTVLLLHAGVADRRMWAQHLAPLATAGHHAVAVDLPEFGEAENGDLAPWDAVLATLDALGIDQAVLIGNSFGGGVALRAAAVAPDRVSALVLVSARPFNAEPSPRLAAAWAAEEDALERGDVDAAIEAVLDTWTLPDAPVALRDQIAVMQRRAYALQLEVPEPELSDPLSSPADLAALRIPTLVLTGEHDMPDFTAAAVELGSALPQVRQATIAAAGHLAPLETPDEFRELVLGFLSEL